MTTKRLLGGRVFREDMLDKGMIGILAGKSGVAQEFIITKNSVRSKTHELFYV